VNATLAQVHTSGPSFVWLKFINGLVAPAFLFASGLAFAVALRRKAPEILAFGPALRKNLGRLTLILAIGYILHLPSFSLARLLSGTTAVAWLTFVQVDVLQCIAATLLLLVLLFLVVRSEQRLAAAAVVGALVFVFAAPSIWSVDYLEKAPAALASYLNGLHGSLFPLFPWSGFLLAGAATGYGIARAKQEDTGGGTRRLDRFMAAAALSGGLLIAASFLLSTFGGALFPPHDPWRSGPGFVLLRLGIVAILMAGMFLYERRAGVSPRSVVTLLGRESLFVYTLHLLLIYGDFGPFNFRRFVDQSFGYGQALVATVVLFAVCSVAALVWARVKAGPARLRRRLSIGFALGLVVVFLLNPG
jgi:uncharacterized membrane protein